MGKIPLRVSCCNAEHSLQELLEKVKAANRQNDTLLSKVYSGESGDCERRFREGVQDAYSNVFDWIAEIINGLPNQK